jgi:hypothetical protein
LDAHINCPFLNDTALPRWRGIDTGLISQDAMRRQSARSPSLLAPSKILFLKPWPAPDLAPAFAQDSTNTGFILASARLGSQQEKCSTRGAFRFAA